MSGICGGGSGVDDGGVGSGSGSGVGGCSGGGCGGVEGGDGWMVVVVAWGEEVSICSRRADPL